MRSDEDFVSQAMSRTRKSRRNVGGCGAAVVQKDIGGRPLISRVADNKLYRSSDGSLTGDESDLRATFARSPWPNNLAW